MTRRILITGSSKGIGFAAAQKFGREHCQVVLNEPSEDGLRRAMLMLEKEGIRAQGVAGSVETAAGCRMIVESAAQLLGGLDVLVNCAGIYRQGASDTFDEAEWDRTLDINLKGTFFTTIAAIPFLTASRGNVVNLASEAGLRGARLSAVYCASKGGVVLLTKAMALEYAPQIRINCVCPGAVDTDMMATVAEASGNAEQYMAAMSASYPLDRIAEPQEVAAAILYLASVDARNITGSALAIDGGSTAGR